MKDFLILCALLVLMTACSASKQLPTTKGEVINITGRWNATDAAIMATQLKQNLQQSPWYKEQLEKGNGPTAIYISNVIYKAMEEPFDKSLGQNVKNSLQSVSQIKLIAVLTNNPNVFNLAIKMNSSAQESFGEEAIQYEIEFTLLNSGGKVVWRDQESIKKYVSE